MKSLRLFKENNLIKKEVYQLKEYCTIDYQRVTDMAGTIVIVQLLKNINDALREQSFLKNDILVLAEKAVSQIDIKSILISKHSSYQMLSSQYFELLNIVGLWQMLQDKFVNFDITVTEDIFRKVAGVIISYLEALSQKEEAFIEQIVDGCISQREDGRIEIIFPGEIWGNSKIVNQAITNAQMAGICFVDIPASPISKKAILPKGWKTANYTDDYTYILDDFNQNRGVFRIKELPNKFNNGEVDFFFDLPQIRQKRLKIGAHQTPIKLLNP